jgi:hypothetical protein
MKKEVREEAQKLIRLLISNETCEINKNARQIKHLADMNTMLKQVRTAHIKTLRDFTEKAKPAAVLEAQVKL